LSYLQAFEAAMDAGASDMVPATDDDGNVTGYKVITALEEFAAVSNALAAQGLQLQFEQSGLVYQPLAEVEVDDDTVYDANEAMLERLLAVDDIDAVYSNFK
jgi:transcriptional/translational regulatory protein YebC/TACO1